MVCWYLHVRNVLSNLHKVSYQHIYNKHTHAVSIHPHILDPDSTASSAVNCMHTCVCMCMCTHTHVRVCVCVCKERTEERKTPGWPRNRHLSLTSPFAKSYCTSCRSVHALLHSKHTLMYQYIPCYTCWNICGLTVLLVNDSPTSGPQNICSKCCI